GRAPLREPDAGRPSLPDGARAPARPVRPPGRRHRRQRGGRLAREGRGGSEARRRPALRSGLGRRTRLRTGDHDALHRARPPRARPAAGADLPVDGAQHALRARPLRPLPARADADLPRRARLPLRRARAADGGERAVTKPALAVWKFASCDGCQLSLLDCEDELLALAGEVEIAYFLEARRQTAPGPYDVSLVEGLITIGACATAGGIQALKNYGDVDAFTSIVYATPAYISSLATSNPISAHVPVDYELRGCPINKTQLLEVLNAFLHGRRPNIPSTSVCTECKARGTVCVTVAHGTPCLGPVTHAGCGALCPLYDRGCFGCFGPMESPNPAALTARLRELGMEDAAVERVFRTFNVKAFEEVLHRG